MLNRMSAVTATLVTVGIFTFSGATLIRSASTLNAKTISHEQEDSPRVAPGDRSNFGFPAISNLSEPNSYFRYCFWNRCR